MTTPEMPVERKTLRSSSRASRVTRVFAVIGLLTVLAGFSVVLKSIGVIERSIFDLLTDSDEAPIRVRNGSMQLDLVSTSQQWAADNEPGKFKIPGTHRHKEEFDVTVTATGGAVCPAAVGTGQEVILTYSDGTNVRLQSAGRHTRVRGENGATLTRDPNVPQRLVYPAAGFITRIAVGSGANPPVMCSFTAANQLGYITILNAP